MQTSNPTRLEQASSEGQANVNVQGHWISSQKAQRSQAATEATSPSRAMWRRRGLFKGPASPLEPRPPGRVRRVRQGRASTCTRPRALQQSSSPTFGSPSPLTGARHRNSRRAEGLLLRTLGHRETPKPKRNHRIARQVTSCHTLE